MIQHSLSGLIQDAQQRMTYEAIKGAQWTFHQIMSKADRDCFDAWLVSINHVLAQAPGTQEHRFITFMADLHSGSYKGQMP